MQSAHLNGIALHYQTIGAPEGRPLIVFANSLATDQRIWRDVIVRLVGDAAILTYDERGHGLSGMGTPPYAMDDHVADLAALLDHVGGRPAVVVGLSVGGMIAQGLALARPDLVAGLVLCDTGMTIADDATWLGRIEAVETGGMEAVAGATMERWFTADYRAAEPDMVALWRAMVSRQPPAGYTGTCEAIRTADFTDGAPRIAAPTLCLVGDDDRATPPTLVRDLARAIPGARFEVVKGAGHLPCVEQPAIVADMIRAFLSLVRDAMGEAEGSG